MSRPITSAVSVLVIAAALTACSTDAPTSKVGTHRFPRLGSQFVALGDSYASEGSNSAEMLGPEECGRTADNYPHQLADAIELHLNDQSCSGGTADDLFLDRSKGIPAQFDALGRRTQLVTLTIGGNDLGFGPIWDCSGRADESDTDSPKPCRDEYGDDLDNAKKKVPDELDSVYGEIKRRAPNARVLATGYYPMLVTGQKCEANASMSDDDIAWVYEATVALNDVVKQAAERNGATYVMPDEAEAHTACADVDQRWTDLKGEETDSAPLHPTHTGQQELATELADTFRHPA